MDNFGSANTVRRPTTAVHALENEGDVVYRSAIAALFADGIEPRELVRQTDMLFCLHLGESPRCSPPT
jgi:hypothetical protein